MLPRRSHPLRAFALLLAGWVSLTLSAQTPVRHTVEVPFDFTQGVVLLEIDLGGKRPARLVLDTGNNRSVLDTEAAAELGIPLDAADKQTIWDGANALTYYRVTPTRCRLVGTDLPVKTLVVMPVRKSFLESGVTCDGTLGYDALKQCVAQVDYPARRVRLLDADDAGTAAARGSVSPITWKKYHHRSPDLVTVENLRVGERTVCAQVDTFFVRTAILFAPKLASLQSQPAPGVAPVRYEEAELAAVRVPGGLTLGTTRLAEDAPVFLAGADAHVPETEIAAVLGSGFFAARVLTLDLPASRLIVQEVDAHAE